MTGHERRVCFAIMRHHGHETRPFAVAHFAKVGGWRWAMTASILSGNRTITSASRTRMPVEDGTENSMRVRRGHDRGEGDGQEEERSDHHHDAVLARRAAPAAELS